MSRLAIVDVVMHVARPREQTVGELLTLLYEESYTGSITLHWINGVPKKVEFPGEQIKLLTGGSPNAGCD